MRERAEQYDEREDALAAVVHVLDEQDEVEGRVAQQQVQGRSHVHYLQHKCYSEEVT